MKRITAFLLLAAAFAAMPVSAQSGGPLDGAGSGPLDTTEARRDLLLNSFLPGYWQDRKSVV